RAVVDGLERLERQLRHLEAVEAAPFAVDLHLQPPDRVAPHEPERLVRRRLLDIGLEPERRRQGQAAEADIGEICRAADVDGEDDMADRALLALLVAPV